MLTNLSKAAKIARAANAQAAGATDFNCTIFDMSGYDAVCFVAAIGALTATQVTSLLVQVGNAANLSDAVTLPLTDGTTEQTAAMADIDSNKILVADFIKPSGYRYCRAVVKRATANAVIDAVIGLFYRANLQPVVQDATVSQSKLGVGKTP